MKIEKLTQTEFTNKRTVGKYVTVSYDANLEGEGSVPVEVGIHYCEKGTGEPVVLIHGVGQSYYSFRNNLLALAKKYWVIALDLPGCGYSDCPDIEYSIADYRAILGEFLAALGIKKASLVGFGQGAIYALSYACAHPQDIRKVVIIHPGCYGNVNYGPAKAIRRPLWRKAVADMGKVSSLTKMFDHYYFDRTIINSIAIKEYARPFDSVDNRMAARLMVCNFDEQEMLAALNSYTGKVLDICAVEDPVHNADEQNNILTHIENAYSLTIRNCGYLVNEEKPEIVNKGILEFLER